MTDIASTPGRTCPLHYRYAPSVFARPPHLADLEALYVVGGLYGNEPALREVLRLFQQEQGHKALVFNGDFHWFDAEPAAFQRIQRAVLAHHALRGNVETELADETAQADAGCGCAYPDWVGEEVVLRSNRILQRLRGATTAAQRAELRALPMWLRADVAGVAFGLVHGDAQSLAGWGFAQEHLQSAEHRADVLGWFAAAQVDAFASSHTCLPVFQSLARGQHWVLNNGAAGMPNFAGDAAGLFTRIAVEPLPDKLCRLHAQVKGLHVQAVAIETDAAAWRRTFVQQWPSGSDAHASYFNRITQGPAYTPSEALRLEE
jgi:hypothetical protein